MTRFLLAILTAFLFTSLGYTQPLHPCAELVWYDEFDETALDATKWTPQLGDGCDINLCGWGNNEAEYYTDRPENVKVESGNLVITALKETYGGKDYTSARIRSYQKGDFTFGRMEASIKLPQGAGSWPAFWMLPTDEVYGPWPQSGELDIMEFQGKNPNIISGTAHYGDPVPNNKYKSGVYSLPSSANYYDSFHTFVIEWDSTSINWYMDGHLYNSIYKNDLKPYRWPFDQQFHIIINNALGGFLGGTIDDSSFPQTMLVDYVRVYKLPNNFKINGRQHLFTFSSGVSYSVPSIADATDYAWSVPAGATIASGQGTNAITVNWGDLSSAGTIALTVTKACGTVDLTLPVVLADNSACSLILDNMDGTTNVVYEDWNSTTFYSSLNNPNTTGNTSAKVGYILKSTLDSSNKVILSELPIDNFSSYETGDRLMYMDIYTNSLPGTTVEIHFFNKAQSMTDYNSSVRTVLTAKTTLARKWQTLVFHFDRIANSSIDVNSLDRMAIVFNPEKTVVNKYFAFDNLRRGAVPYHSITGNASPEACDVTNETYSVASNASTNYVWNVPTGTSINSGQGTEQISVNWGTTTIGKIYLTESTSSCTDYSASFDVNVVSCPTAILSAEASKALSLYPNPAKDLLTISCQQNISGNPKLIIISSLGEQVMEKYMDVNASDFNEQINIQSLKPGYYIIRLTDDANIWSSSFVKY